MKTQRNGDILANFPWVAEARGSHSSYLLAEPPRVVNPPPAPGPQPELEAESGSVPESFPDYISTNYVHCDQESVTFWPHPGDIILRAYAEPSQVVALQRVVQLYKDCLFSNVLLTPNVETRNMFNSLVFRKGDHILRLGGFYEYDTIHRTSQLSWTWIEYSNACVWIYWPGFHDISPWVRLTSSSPIQRVVRPLPLPSLKPRARPLLSQKLFIRGEGSDGWETSDIIIRGFDPGPESPKNPGWKKLYGVRQLQNERCPDYKKLIEGDLLVRLKCAMRGPMARLELNCYRFLGIAEMKVMFMGTDSFEFVFNEYELLPTGPSPRLGFEVPEFTDVPQPGDILLSFDEEFRPFDAECKLGGFVQLYQLQQPLRSVAQAGNPMVLRCGYFKSRPVPLSTSSRKSGTVNGMDWEWVYGEKFRIFTRHPRHSDGKTWMLQAQMDKPLRFERFPPYVLYEETLEQQNVVVPNMELNFMSDLVIRADSSNSGSYETSSYNYLQIFPKGLEDLKPGDLLVRTRPFVDTEKTPGSVTLMVELYALILDDQNKPVIIFRGRDQVHYGRIPPSPLVTKRQSVKSPRTWPITEGDEYTPSSRTSGFTPHVSPSPPPKPAPQTVSLNSAAPK
ncbi:hypothetical protein MPTK1_3g22560 [Marchantia polymorpha subsp. ruderalis]|uniref:Uncharacterized protein n=2 Tax=Marchantia polymorpha TaxID=3197 RepID=A0AAF6B3N2_MARPO|nr:hypothetical protein MARPO_0024s0034 [Marchantia polymorpha]BBN06616.1 hypothetical protein Mp_3g22560 [Marchantia polymorpha subsp. ruderalis]|eukprot:PTQ43516.1 hypothetical protein MARPO_0024s0034 [Marchantia polymorpha]